MTPGPGASSVHGNPALNTVYWTEDRSDDFCRKMAEQAGARPGDVLAFGHTHVPWTREVDGRLRRGGRTAGGGARAHRPGRGGAMRVEGAVERHLP